MIKPPLGLLRCLIHTVTGVWLLALTGCLRAEEPDADAARAHDIATATGIGGEAGEVVAPAELAEPTPKPAPETTGAELVAPETSESEGNSPKAASATAPPEPSSHTRRPNR